MAAEWREVWRDDFNGKDLDWTKWSAEENGHGGGNGELQYYLDRSENLRVEGGHLILEARKEKLNIAGVQKDYSSARIRTKRRADWLYGRFEMSAQLPAGKGLWPAFWMLPSEEKYGGWAASGEIDIMEYKGHSPTVTYGTLHFAGSGGAHEMLGGTKDTLVDLSLDYHRYGMLWKPDEITFYIDDNVVYTARKSASNLAVWPFGPNAQGQDPSFYLILNLAMGGNFGGAIDANLDRTALSVDWVRYYSVDGLGKVNNK